MKNRSFPKLQIISIPLIIFSIIFNICWLISAEVRPDPNQPKPEIHGGGLTQIYQLDHLHFHWQSEHTVDGYR